MKKSILLTGFLCGLLLFGGTAMALTINSGAIDVGSLDNLLDSEFLANSSAANELAWIKRVLGTDYTISNTYNVNSGNWTAVDGESYVFATDLNNDPSHFFIKIGTGSFPAGSNTHFLYSNSADLSYAVINYASWGFGTANRVNIGRVSHIGEVGGAPVPEPATVLLLGTGLFGLVIASRKKFKK